MNIINTNDAYNGNFNEIPLKIQSSDVIVENTVIDNTTTPPTKIDNSSGAANYLNAQNLFENLQNQQNKNTNDVAALKSVIDVTAHYDTSLQVNDKINTALSTSGITSHFNAGRAVYANSINGALQSAISTSGNDIQALGGISGVLRSTGNINESNEPDLSLFINSTDSRISDLISTKAPTNHASSRLDNDSGYGVGTSALFGHLKIADNLSTNSFAATNPVALSAYRGYLLKNTYINQTCKGILVKNQQNEYIVNPISGDGTIIPLEGNTGYTFCWTDPQTNPNGKTVDNFSIDKHRVIITNPGMYLIIMIGLIRPTLSTIAGWDNTIQNPETITQNNLYKYLCQNLSMKLKLKLKRWRSAQNDIPAGWDSADLFNMVGFGVEDSAIGMTTKQFSANQQICFQGNSVETWSGGDARVKLRALRLIIIKLDRTSIEN